MCPQLSRDELSKISSYDEFVDLSLRLDSANKSELFNFIFPISISAREFDGDKSPGVAARLLVAIEPAHTRSCELLLDEIAKSKWDVSCKSIPFYLITQFGKSQLKAHYNNYISYAKLSEEQKRRVGTIIYWSAGPSADLVSSYHDWPWRESE